MMALRGGSRTCPYCRSPLGAGEATRECTACHAVHHADCWAENGGCAVALCAGGPSDDEEASDEEPASPAPAQPAASAAGAGLLPVIVGVIVVLGGGTAAAIVLTQQHHPASEAPADAPSGAERAAAEAAPAEPPEAEPPPAPEPTYRPTRPERVERALQAHFRRLVAGNYAGAYHDLTPGEGTTIGGEAAWITAQRDDALKHFELTVDVSMHGSGTATAEIAYFATHARGTGCHTWTGSWEMVKRYGHWLIGGANLERGSC